MLISKLRGPYLKSLAVCLGSPKLTTHGEVKICFVNIRFCEHRSALK